MGDEKLSHRSATPALIPLPTRKQKNSFTANAQKLAQMQPAMQIKQANRAATNSAAISRNVASVPANVALRPFFKALARVKSGTGGQVTILHLGDSHIAADHFSGDLRYEFQLSFGDAGRGMLMPGLYSARDVKFEQGGNWQVAVSAMGAPGPYTLTGAKVWSSNRNAWMRITSMKAPFDWAEVSFETGPQGGSAFISLDGEGKRVSTAEPARSWKTLRLTKTAREVLIKPVGDGQIILHAINIGSNKPGVRYVSFGLPGATAVTPLSWTRSLVHNDLKRLAPDLIVFGYGTEESLKGKLDLAKYDASVNASLAMLRQAAPQASLLVLGPPDIAKMPAFAVESGKANNVCSALDAKEIARYARSIRKKDPRIAHWHPPLQLDAIRLILKRAAAANNAYFWDWSKVMGGTCGIHAWVHSDPPLAAADHVHLTEAGSKRSARILFRELITAFEGFSYTSSTSVK
ncbi:MAG: SGNH/GDSL hydrolase family protein [Alphaproteobacteria bacterium]